MGGVTKHPDLTEDISHVLVDGDILLYEMSFGAEYKDEQGEKQVMDFDYVANSLERWYDYIAIRLGCDNITTYLTGKGNFRQEIAKSVPYKDKRPGRPFHYQACRDWIICNHGAIVVDGMEADDKLAIEQNKLLKQGLCPIIVSRDKDLMMVEGWHYGWEVGRQPEKLSKATKLGTLSLGTGSKKKLSGDGLKWFYAQCLMGDAVDTIPGLPKVGPVFAYNLLNECETEEELYHAVRDEYHNRGFDDVYFLEQAQLLWMCTEEDEEGNPVMWELKDV